MVKSLPGFLILCLNVCSPSQVLGEVYIEVRGFSILRHRDNDRFFLEEVGTTEQVLCSKGLIKYGCKQTSNLISAGPQNAASNPIRSGCFPGVHSL